MQKPFGRELLLDIYGCSKNLSDIGAGSEFLSEAVIELDMYEQSRPYVIKSPLSYINRKGKVVNCPTKDGLSGCVLLIESAITIHTLAPKKFVSLNFYTCGQMDEEMAAKMLKLTKKYFGWKKEEHQILDRGVTYNK